MYSTNQYEHLARERMSNRLREAETERMAAAVRHGDDSDAILPRVRRRGIAAVFARLAPALRQRPSLRGV
jgi:hypothetical protein